MSATIVYVHGNGNKVRKDLLKAEWDRALLGEDLGKRSRMAYWAPLRYPHPLPDPAFDELELLSVSPLEAPPPVAPTAAFIAEVQNEARAEGNSDTDPLEAWLTQLSYTADALAEGEAAASPPTSHVEAWPSPRAVRTTLFREFVRLTYKDVHAYFFTDLAKRMRAVVHEELDGAEGPIILLSHSLGTIIAYDVLRERREPPPEIPLLLTIGSPLGVPWVQDLIRRPLEVPAGVRAWRNVCDARDLAALDETLRPEFSPPELCTDFLVSNDSATHHGMREYLCTVPVREPVLELIGT